MALRALAFYFTNESAAQGMYDALPTHGVAPDRAAVAPLVIDRVEGTVVAFMADDGQLDAVVALATKHGGRLVADVPGGPPPTASV